MTTTITERDPLRDALSLICGGDILIDLDRVARVLNAPSRDAVRYKVVRGTLRTADGKPVRAIRSGGQTGEILVPAADLYALLGLEWEPTIALHQGA